MQCQQFLDKALTEQLCKGLKIMLECLSKSHIVCETIKLSNCNQNQNRNKVKINNTIPSITWTHLSRLTLLKPLKVKSLKWIKISNAKNHLALKVVSATFLLVCFVCLKESTCETRKNVFYFTSKALFAFEIIKF